LKTIGFTKNLTGQLRAAVFKSLTRYVPVAQKQKDLDGLIELAISLKSQSDEILSDM
jgi:hypothetical protein